MSPEFDPKKNAANRAKHGVSLADGDGVLCLRSAGLMKKEYDFSRRKRGPVVASQGKTRMTIYLDDEVLERFRTTQRPLTAKQVREILREELASHAGG